MQGELVGQVTTLGDFDRVDLADEVGDRRVGRRQFLAEARFTVHPFDRGVVAVLTHQIAGVLRHRVIGIVVDLGSGDHRQPFVEQRHEQPDHAALRLTSLAEEDDVVAGEERVLELRQHGSVVTEHAGEERLALLRSS